MKKTTWFASVMVLSLVMASCGGGSASGGYTKLKNGMEYKIISTGSGKVIAYGEVMKFHMAQKYKDSIMKDSYSQPPQYQPVDSMQLPKEYFEVFKQVKAGDSVITRILTDSVFKGGMQMMPKEFKKGEYLVTVVKVLDVLKADKAQEDFSKEVQKFREQDSIRAIGQKVKDEEALMEYFTKNNIKASKTQEGTFYEIQQAGGEPAKPGQAISVKYTGKLLDGTVFDSNIDSSFHHTEPFTITIGAGGSIKGFDDGLRNFGKGAKGRLYIPSVMAYGAQGQGKLKPNSNLIFDVEVLDVKDPQTAPLPTQPMIMPTKPGAKVPAKKN